MFKDTDYQVNFLAEEWQLRFIKPENLSLQKGMNVPVSILQSGALLSVACCTPSEVSYNKPEPFFVVSKDNRSYSRVSLFWDGWGEYLGFDSDELRVVRHLQLQYMKQQRLER
jgi:hypothetical protein